ncbi:MAG: hypothetical protein QNJ22_11430 [Desulfosarcinaceae bacterium]|nr:hypothetical protein [Desulfosarcinaceae bacterium]
MSKRDADHTAHPFYIFGSGVAIGVVATFSFMSFIIMQNYVEKENVNAFIEKQGKAIIDAGKLSEYMEMATEYAVLETGQTRSDSISDEATAPPAVPADTSFQISLASPLVRVDDELSLLLLKIEPSRARFQFNFHLSPKKEKRLFIYRDKPQTVSMDDRTYVARLLEIRNGSEVIVNCTKY